MTEAAIQQNQEAHGPLYDFYFPISEGVALAEQHFDEPIQYDIAKNLEDDPLIISILLNVGLKPRYFKISVSFGLRTLIFHLPCLKTYVSLLIPLIS